MFYKRGAMCGFPHNKIKVAIGRIRRAGLHCLVRRRFPG